LGALAGLGGAAGAGMTAGATGGTQAGIGAGLSSLSQSLPQMLQGPQLQAPQFGQLQHAQSQAVNPVMGQPVNTSQISFGGGAGGPMSPEIMKLMTMLGQYQGR